MDESLKLRPAAVRRLVFLAALLLVSALLAAPARAEDTADQLLTRGFEAFQQKDYEGALQWYRRALDACRAARNRAGESLVLFGMAAAYNRTGRYVDCVEALKESCEIRRQIGDRAGEKKALDALASVYLGLAEAAGEKDGKARSGCLMLASEALHAADRSEEAAKAAQSAIELRRKAGERVPLAVSQAQLALYLSRCGRRDEAIKLNLEAIAVLHAEGDRAGEGTTLSNLGQLYADMGRDGDALAAWARARDVHHSTGNAARELSNAKNIAAALYRLGRWEEALAAWRDTASIAQRQDDAATRRTCLGNVGLLLDALGRSVEAERVLQEALQLARASKDRRAESVALINLGATQNHMGRKEDALRHFQDAVDAAGAVPDEELAGVALSNQGEIYWQLARHDDALRHYDRALALFRQVRSEAHEAITLANVAAVYDAQERIQEALDTYTQVLALMRSLGRTAEVSSVLNNLAALHGRQGRAELALKLYGESLALLKRLGRRDAAAVTMRNIGVVQEEAGHPAEAMQAFTEALSELRAVGNQDAEGQTLFDLGLLLYRAGQKAEALKRLAAAIDLLETVAAGFHVAELKSDFLSKTSSRYAATVAAFFEQQRSPEAFLYAERAKARAFLDSLGGARVDLKRGVPPGLLARERDLQARIDARRQRIAAGDATPEQYGELSRLRDEYAQVLREIALRSPERAALRAVQVAALPALRAALDDDTVLIAVFAGVDQTFAWALTKDGGLAGERFDGGENQVREEVEEARSALRTPSRNRPIPLRGVLRQLVSFMEKHGQNRKRFLVVPHAALHYLPFGPLPDSQGGLLGDRWSIVVAPSASSWYYLRQRKAEVHADRVAVFALGDAVPPGGGTSSLRGGLPPLPGTLAEAKGLARLFGSTARVFAGQECRRAGVSERAAGSRYLHFATHGVLDEKAPAFSSLAMSDGYLTVIDILGLDLDASMVCLSACETASGRLTSGDEVVGLTRAFLEAGPRTVVSSLWKVPDESTAMLMQEFYRHLKEGHAPDEALRLARTAVRARWPAPLYWAAFEVYGDWR